MSTENYHHVTLTIERGELHRGFTCTAPEDAPCRRRPPEPYDHEAYSAAAATEPGHQCWAVEWVEAVGIRDSLIANGADQVLASIPVHISFEDGVGFAPIGDPAPADGRVRTISDAAAIDQIIDRYKTFGQEWIFENPSSTIESIGDTLEQTGRQAWFEEPGYLSEGEDAD